MREERERREKVVGRRQRERERERERERKYGVFRNELGFKGEGYWV